MCICLFVLLSFCLLSRLWSNVWRVSSLKSHSLCPNSKLAASESLTKGRYRAARAAKTRPNSTCLTCYRIPAALEVHNGSLVEEEHYTNDVPGEVSLLLWVIHICTLQKICIGPTYTWGPVYGFGCLFVCNTPFIDLSDVFLGDGDTNFNCWCH